MKAILVANNFALLIDLHALFSVERAVVIRRPLAIPRLRALLVKKKKLQTRLIETSLANPSDFNTGISFSFILCKTTNQEKQGTSALLLNDRIYQGVLLFPMIINLDEITLSRLHLGSDVREKSRTKRVGTHFESQVADRR